jgi:hypothetical protein
MGKTYTGIDDGLRSFIAQQHVFFVATAPLAANGHVNVSPKGLDAFRLIDSTTVAYLDYVGSGAETIAHVRENQRITILFCAFEGPPKILRLFGRADALEPHDDEYSQLRDLFPDQPGERSIVRVRLDRIADTCGFGVPRYAYTGQRTQLSDWASRKGPEGLMKYQRDHNARSLDGLPALRWVAAGHPVGE